MTATPPDRVTLATAAMQALLRDGVRPTGDPDAVGTGSIVCSQDGVIAGLPLAVQIFGRSGVRCRPCVTDGDRVVAGDEVARLGGPVAAIEAAGRTAERVLARLSAIASGSAEPTFDDPVEAYAAAVAADVAAGGGGHPRLPRDDAVEDDGTSFRPSFRVVS